MGEVKEYRDRYEKVLGINGISNKIIMFILFKEINFKIKY